MKEFTKFRWKQCTDIISNCMHTVKMNLIAMNVKLFEILIKTKKLISIFFLFIYIYIFAYYLYSHFLFLFLSSFLFLQEKCFCHYLNIGCLTKAKEPHLPYYFPIDGRIHTFPKYYLYPHFLFLSSLLFLQEKYFCHYLNIE